MIHYLALVLMGPVFVVQGLYVRKVTPQLEEATGARSGRCGQGKLLRLLLIGDSAAAGVGVHNQSKALSGNLVGALSEKFQLEWQLLAKSGYTTKDTYDMLIHQPKEHYDVVVASLGVNDVIKTLTTKDWLNHQKALVVFIREHFSCRQIVLTKIPPMEKFPALPPPLRWYLGRKARDFNRHLSHWTTSQDDCELIDINHRLTTEQMATDGFHPGPGIYQFWGQSIAQVIKTRWHSND
ncbi:SGNH/GDSL hydrolase family protein [Photobacterium sagamiensis]|uniref:SGNH/GDSL hydrolase family protein n=1 Tax=Photobacterium sagamiensis TaxID=2910241 RepID=UPI003D12F284